MCYKDDKNKETKKDKPREMDNKELFIYGAKSFVQALLRNLFR